MRYEKHVICCLVSFMSASTEPEISFDRREITDAGLRALDEEIEKLVSGFRRVLAGLGRTDLAEVVPWTEGGAGSGEASPGETARVLSIAFQLLDMAEERVGLETRRIREIRFDAALERGSWAHSLDELKARGWGENEIAAILGAVRVEPVFTAHPTEAKRPSVRERHSELYRRLEWLDQSNLTSAERAVARERLDAAIEALFFTGEIHTEQPTVERELLNALHYLRNVFPGVIKRVRGALALRWAEAGFDPATLSDLGAMVRFGIWIGGDRDGHPFVTAEVTRDTLARLREQALKLHRDQLKEAADHLSLSPDDIAVPEELNRRIAELAAGAGAMGDAILERNRGEPWRQLIYLMRASLDEEDYGLADFTGDLKRLGRTLEEAGAARLSREWIDPLLRCVDVFGLHLADLDVRQNSAFHDRALARMLEAAGIPDGASFATWEEERRLALLTAELASPRPLLHPGRRLGGEADTVRDCYRVLAEHWKRHGSGLGSLIVSMTRQVSDLLVVHLFAREAGLWDEDRGCPLNVVPLFETLDDLHRAAGITREYLSHPAVRRTFAGDGGQEVQQIMLGYSDSNKDGGIIASRHALYRAQDDIGGIGREFGVEIRFFHGRGGSLSRGGGPTEWFIKSLPRGALGGDFRMTEQGETIAIKYANPDNAAYHLEALEASVALATNRDREVSDPDRERVARFIAPLAERSREVYRQLIEADQFMAFYRQATPIDALEQKQMGSRPSRRTGMATLEDLRAIPWVFSWTQSRFYLPGWYGVGSALTALERTAPETYRNLIEEISDFSFARYLFTTIETNVVSADPLLMRRYAELVGEESLREEFLTRIEEEYRATRVHLSRLLPVPIEERRPRFYRTLELRDEPLRRLHLHQVALLREWRSAGGELPRDLSLLINAIASGLRNTG